MAVSTYVVILSYGTDAPETDVEIIDFPSLRGVMSGLETTTLSSDSQTYTPGIRQREESFDFTALYDYETYAEINAVKGVQKCKLTFSDGTNFTWDGYLTVSVNEGDVDDVIEMTISITPTTDTATEMYNALLRDADGRLLTTTDGYYLAVGKV
jgi:hypothetical protein